MKQLLLFFSILLSSIISNAQSAFVTTANVNMRTLPCTCAGISSVIPKGTIVEVLNYEDESWARVSYNGHINYISSRRQPPVTITMGCITTIRENHIAMIATRHQGMKE